MIAMKTISFHPTISVSDSKAGRRLSTHMFMIMMNGMTDMTGTLSFAEHCPGTAEHSPDLVSMFLYCYRGQGELGCYIHVLVLLQDEC